MFTKNGFYYLIQQDKFESKEHFNQRKWFITSQVPETKEEFNEAEKLSRLWMNNKKFKCTYSIDSMNKISKLEENIWCK